MQLAFVDCRRSGFGLLIAVATLLSASPAMARPTEPSATDRQIALAVSLLMEKQHLAQKGVDDLASERCLTSLLKTLDPLKLYFRQSDVDEFSTSKHQLDDMVRRGDIRIAYRIFNRFLQRVDERVAVGSNK